MLFYFRKPIIQDCENFKNNCCFDSNCSFLHRYKYCFQYQNTTCSNERCRFLHCTGTEQLRYETTGVITEYMKREIGRTLQISNICGDFKYNTCNRTKCKLRHINWESTMSMACIICTNNLNVENIGAGNCGHLLCHNCALWSLYNEDRQQIEIRCPVCRSICEYNKLY